MPRPNIMRDPARLVIGDFLGTGMVSYLLNLLKVHKFASCACAMKVATGTHSIVLLCV